MTHITCDFEVDHPDWRRRTMPAAEAAVLAKIPQTAKRLVLPVPLAGCQVCEILPSGVRLIVASRMNSARDDFELVGRCDIQFED